jgi:predicted branched-subunit amino acid permease
MIQILPPSTEITLTGPTKWMTLLDGACLFLLALPLASTLIGFSGPNRIFFLFPAGLESSLPVGIIVLTIQLFKRKKRRHFSVLSILVVIMSVITLQLGIMGWVLIFVVTS